MAYQDKADWINVDASTLTSAQRSAWEAVKEGWRKQREAKAAFETAMRQAYPTPDGKKLVFAYNYGKLSVALVDGDVAVKASAKPKLTIAQYLAEQSAR